MPSVSFLSRLGRRPISRTRQLLSMMLLVAASVVLSTASRAADYPLHDDVSTLDGLMHAYYDVVSGPANTPRNVARDASLHHADAQLMVPDRDANGKLQLRRFNVREFHQWSAPVYANGFYEKEIHREVLNYGRLTHIWSTYETRLTPDGSVMGRGINSIQVYFDDHRYWIVAETWDSERADNAIPARFLPTK